MRQLDLMDSLDTGVTRRHIDTVDLLGSQLVTYRNALIEFIEACEARPREEARIRKACNTASRLVDHSRYRY